MLLVVAEVLLLLMDQHHFNMGFLEVLVVVVDWFRVVPLQQVVQEHQDKVMLAVVLNIVQVHLLEVEAAVVLVVPEHLQLLRVPMVV
jgi:hypothetical protein